MAEKFSPMAALVGRIFIAVIFLNSGYGKIMGFAGTQKYMESHGLPLVSILLVSAIFAEIAGGLSLVLGVYTRLGALALLLFMIPTTLIFHTDFTQRIQVIHFLKNLAIMGGILAFMAMGDGGLGYDSWRKRG
ncbi:MAG: DoxX family protein [Deltaproteobacteria bacterium]|nr:DoxX family protein [Deltaproteobacteria bacterium]MBW2308959.1 DoxX family protein [Deltaproteobacteria bacterium]